MRALTLASPDESPAAPIRIEHVLVTGFEPFATHAKNPSTVAAYAAVMTLSRQITTAFRVLPVTYTAVVELQKSAYSGGLHLHFGLAADAAAVRIEQFAHNCADASPDNAGFVPSQRPFTCEADAYTTAFDCAAIVKELHARTIKARISRDCGGYVCNAAYFASLDSEQADRLAAALFVHIPMLSDADAARTGSAVADSVWTQLTAG